MKLITKCGAKAFLFALFGLSMASVTHAATYTWRGTNSTAWTTAGNWLALSVGPTGTAGLGHRLDVNNAAFNGLVYDASLGTTYYGSAGGGAVRGFAIGSGGNGSGTLTITGGTLITTNGNAGDVIGNSDNNTGILNVNGGTLVSGSSTLGIGLGGGVNRTSTLNVNSGSATVGSISINTLRGTINLNGGTLAASNIVVFSIAGVNATNNFNGGTLQARGSTTGFFPTAPLAVSRAQVRDGGAVIDTAGFNITMAQPLIHSTISGDAAIDGGLTKNGNGTLTLSGAPTYTGPTRVNVGRLTTLLPASSSSLVLANGSRFTPAVTNFAWLAGSAALTNATMDFNYGSFFANPNTNASLYLTNLAISGSVTCNIAGTGFPVTNLTLLSYGSKTGGGAFVLGSLPAGAVATLNDDGANVTVNITTASIQNLVWSASFNSNWATNEAANWNSGTASYLEYPSGVNDAVTFNDTSSGTVNINSQVNPSGTTVDVTSGFYNFSGAGSIGGTNGITKLGTSTLQINNANNFTGPVTISGGSGTTGGTLFVNHANALGATNGMVTVNGPANTLEIGTPSGSGITASNKSVTINGTGVGGARGALRGTQSSSGSNVWAGPVIIGTDLSRIGTEDNGNLTVSGPITDNGANIGLILRPGANGIVTISGTGSAYGYTRTFGHSDGSGIVKLGANDALSTNRLELGLGYVDMNGFNQAFVGILDVAGNGKIINNGVADSTLTVGSTNNYTTYGDVLAGAGTLNVVKVGSGSQTLASANITYAGTTTVSQGQLVINNATTLATSITVAGGATLDTEATTTGTLTLSNNAVLVANGSTAGALTASSIDATASPINVSFSAAPAPAADVIILSAAGGITGSAANFQVLGARSGTFSLQNGNTELHYVAPASATTLTWKGNDPVSPTFWDLTTSTNWSNAGNPDKFYTGDNVLFDNSATTFNVAIQGASVAPAAVTFNSASNYVVSGGAISGATTVDKSGSGTVTLASGNSYSGQTTVSAGVLAIKTSSSLGSTSAGTVISGSGTLDFGAATTANGIDLAAEVVTVSGSGNGGAGAIINNSALQQLNALRQLVLAGNASVGGPGVSLDGNQQPISTGVGRWDMRGTGNAMDMAGNTLTKVGSNFVSLAGTTISNPGNIVIESGVLGIQKEANLNGSAANSLTIQSNGILNFFESFVAPTWTLNLTNGSRFWTQSGTGTGTNVWAGPVALNGAAVLDANGGTMIISGNVSGPGSFTKVGPNTTSLYGDSTYSGGTTITNGVIWAGANTALGTGPVTINSSAIRLVVADNQTITNHIIINGGGASFRGLIENSGAGNATLAGSTITVNGPVSAGGHFASAGGGTLTISNAIVATVNTNIVSRIGTVIFAGGGSYAGFSVAEGTVRLGANNGLCPTSLVSVATSANANLDLAGFSQTLSGIQRTSGSAAVITNSSTVSDSTLTLVGTSSYSGLINDASVAGSRIALNVNGGNLTLSGTNTYSGGTVVTNGTLHINATTAAGTGTVAAKNGGTLSGNGTVSGAATLDAGSTLAPGNNGIGTLTFSSGLAIGGNVAVELNKSLAQSNDLVSVTGSLNKTGTGQLIVSNLGPALVVGDKFTLFSPALGNGAALTIVPPAGVTFTNNLAVDGSITVLTVPSLTPPTLNFVNLGGGSLQFSWTGGGTLQAQTNSLSVGLGTNWVDYPGSSPVTVPMNPANGSVFFRVKQ